MPTNKLVFNNGQCYNIHTTIPSGNEADAKWGEADASASERGNAMNNIIIEIVVGVALLIVDKLYDKFVD